MYGCTADWGPEDDKCAYFGEEECTIATCDDGDLCNGSVDGGAGRVGISATILVAATTAILLN